MGVEFGANDASKLLGEIKATREVMMQRDGKTAQRLSDVETSLDDLYRRLGRSGADGGSARALERKAAVEMCEDRRSWAMQKSEGGRWQDYTPSSDELEEAIVAQRAFKAWLRNHGDCHRLDHLEQKSLSAFAFGNSG